MVTAARSLGVIELFVLAAGAGGLVVLAGAWVTLRQIKLDARRRLSPHRVHAGTASQVEITLTNNRRANTPVLALHDAFAGATAHSPVRWARFSLAPLRRGEETKAAYRLPTERRGLHHVGPLEAIHRDPFGLAQRARRIAPALDLIVYPRVDAIVAPAHFAGRDVRAGSEHASGLGPSGEELYGLRAYEIGDDLRRVHWPSTARLDQLMIRQHETPRRGRVVVVLDDRDSSHDADSLEVAVSAAASVVDVCVRVGVLVRLVTAGGIDTAYGSGHGFRDVIMENLAVLQPSRDRSIEALLTGLAKEADCGAVVAVLTSRTAASELATVARVQARVGTVTVVIVDRAGPGSGAGLARLPRLVRVGSGSSFSKEWNRAMAPAGVGRG